MNQLHDPELAHLFLVVKEVLTKNREQFNLADTINGNHGDHMVEIFHLAARAALEKGTANFAEVMFFASELLKSLEDNGSARIYGLGLAEFAAQFQIHNISLVDLIHYIKNYLGKESNAIPDQKNKDKDILKALVSGLTGWKDAESTKESRMNLLSLFDLGIIYFQACERGDSKVEILADAAATASPLSKIPYRQQSAKMALQTLLEAMSV